MSDALHKTMSLQMAFLLATCQTWRCWSYLLWEKWKGCWLSNEASRSWQVFANTLRVQGWWNCEHKGGKGRARITWLVDHVRNHYNNYWSDENSIAKVTDDGLTMDLHLIERFDSYSHISLFSALVYKKIHKRPYCSQENTMHFTTSLCYKEKNHYLQVISVIK